MLSHFTKTSGVRPTRIVQSPHENNNRSKAHPHCLQRSCEKYSLQLRIFLVEYSCKPALLPSGLGLLSRREAYTKTIHRPGYSDWDSRCVAIPRRFGARGSLSGSCWPRATGSYRRSIQERNQRSTFRGVVGELRPVPLLIRSGTGGKMPCGAIHSSVTVRACPSCYRGAYFKIQ